jgi:predicted dehydrogenase
MIMSSNLSRRTFLKSSAVGASALALGTTSVARGFPANEKVQIGWVGIGGRCGNLMDLMLRQVPDARTIAVCDLIPERVEHGKKFWERDKPKGYTKLAEMLEKEKLDGVLAVTEPCNHSVVVVPILQAGVHCFAEKPMDTSVEKIDAITRAARKAKGVIYQIGTQRRYSPPHLAAMEIIHSGKLGKVMFMQGHWHWAHRPTEPRRVARDGGMLVEQASHHTDVMLWAMGDKAPLTCSAAARTQMPTPEGPNVHNEQQSATVWQWAGGEIFSYTHLLWLARRFQTEQLDVHCEKAGVDVAHGVLHWADYTPENAAKSPDELKDQFADDPRGDWGMGTKEELAAFVANIKSGGKQPINANVETGRICSLMCLMGRMAAVNAARNAYEPRVIQWKELGSTTDRA